MKLTYLFATIALATFSVTSCNNDEAKKETNTSEQTETDAMLLNTQPAAPGGLSGAQSASVVAQPAATQAQSATSAATQAQTAVKGSTQAAKTAAGMNPAHGEPGHRCDIAVGAPLNSPPSAPAAASKTVTMPPTTGAAPSTQISTAPAKAAGKTSGSGKINPAHGQPGHDCAVPVGAPLKS